MHYKAKNIAALQTLLDGWSAQKRVEVDPGVGVSAKTVGDLRKLTTWPENLAITTTPDHSSGVAIKVSKASVATRFAPKP
jgi:hypothetical protein